MHLGHLFLSFFLSRVSICALDWLLLLMLLLLLHLSPLCRLVRIVVIRPSAPIQII